MTLSLPSDELLFKFASGVLDPALRLLIEAHLAIHPQTRARIDDFTRFGGMMLAAEPAIEMTAGSLDRALARIAAEPPRATVDAALPALDTLAWRWAGPGRRIAPIKVEGSAFKAYALRIAPGKAMLQHSHVDHEWTLIVQGAYRDESGEYRTGAFIEEDSETSHQPIATGNEDCICLAVMSGPLSAPGLMGALAHWIMR